MPYGWTSLAERTATFDREVVIPVEELLHGVPATEEVRADLQRAGADIVLAVRRADRLQEVAAQVREQGRRCRPTAVLFLASPASSYITGTTLAVDGGMSGH